MGRHGTVLILLGGFLTVHDPDDGVLVHGAAELGGVGNIAGNSRYRRRPTGEGVGKVFVLRLLRCYTVIGRCGAVGNTRVGFQHRAVVVFPSDGVGLYVLHRIAGGCPVIIGVIGGSTIIPCYLTGVSAVFKTGSIQGCRGLTRNLFGSSCHQRCFDCRCAIRFYNKRVITVFRGCENIGVFANDFYRGGRVATVDKHHVALWCRCKLCSKRISCIHCDTEIPALARVAHWRPAGFAVGAECPSVVIVNVCIVYRNKLAVYNLIPLKFCSGIVVGFNRVVVFGVGLLGNLVSNENPIAFIVYFISFVTVEALGVVGGCRKSIIVKARPCHLTELFCKGHADVCLISQGGDDRQIIACLIITEVAIGVAVDDGRTGNGDSAVIRHYTPIVAGDLAAVHGEKAGGVDAVAAVAGDLAAEHVEGTAIVNTALVAGDGAGIQVKGAGAVLHSTIVAGAAGDGAGAAAVGDVQRLAVAYDDNAVGTVVYQIITV